MSLAVAAGAARGVLLAQPAAMTEASKAQRWSRQARRDRRSVKERIMRHRGERMSPASHAVISADIAIVVMAGAIGGYRVP